MNETFYFSHDYNTREDPKIMKLIRIKGATGYGLYWCIVESLAMNGGKLKIKYIEELAYQLRIDNKDITSLLQDFDLFLIDEKTEEFYSERLLKHFEKRDEYKKKKSEAGKLGMAKRWGNYNSDITGYNTGITKHNKGKERKGKEIKIKEDFLIKINNGELRSKVDKELYLHLDKFPSKKINIPLLNQIKGNIIENYPRLGN